MLNKNLRRKLIIEGYCRGSVHFASSLSCLDTVKYLYDEVLKKEDIFILSKGHGDLALNVVLEFKGYHPEWKPHLDLNEKEGIMATTGSLGHGLPIGLGRAFAKRIKGEEGNVYVLCGDGEMQEGSNWEALNIANKLKLDNLNLLIDYNKYQATGSIQDIGGFNNIDLEHRLEAFGCNVRQIDGHNYEGLSYLKELEKGLNGVILKTIKGYGVKEIEETHNHSYKFTKENFVKTIIELNNKWEIALDDEYSEKAIFK
jgi:transketolase